MRSLIRVRVCRSSMFPDNFGYAQMERLIPVDGLFDGQASDVDAGRVKLIIEVSARSLVRDAFVAGVRERRRISMIWRNSNRSNTLCASSGRQKNP